MAFTSGNDINILQGTDAGSVGAGAGDDRYVLDASTLNADQQITISDAQGANTLQLVGGLEIVSSLVTGTAVQLVLNNGAKITVLGANTFNFQTGGNPLNGTGGLVQNFADFVTLSLGLAEVPTGNTPVEGDTVTVQETGGTEPVDPTNPTEPTEPTEPVEPVVDHYELRAAKAEANEGEANTFTVVAVDVDGNEVAVKEAVSVVFELKIAAGDTASLADFNAGAFNPVTVTIAAGQAVSAPFSVEPITNDGTETTETYTVTATVAGETLTANATILDGSAGAGQTFMLTTGIDTLTGTAGNDTFNAPVSDGGTPTQTLGGLDSIDGGAGTDTLKVDFGSAAAVLPATATIKNIEILDVATSNTAAASNIDVSNIAGVQTVTLANGGDQNSTVKGGENVTVSGGAIANVSGISLKSVTINKVAGDGAAAADIVISNDTAAAVGTGATLTSVVLNDIASTAAVATVAGNAVSEITVQNQKSALATTITNAVSTALKVNVDNAGYNAAGTAVAGVVVTAGAKAEAITVNATGSKSNVTVNAAAAKTLSLTGSADLALAGVSGAALTSIDGTAATGGLDLGVLNAGTATVKTGSGADKFEIKATKVTVDAGAGNDIVTIGSAIAAGSTINLGAGDDVLQFATGGSVAANTTTATTTIDAGDGIDSLAAVLVNATNAKQFVNFERIDATTGNVTLDVDLMTGSTIGGVTLNGGSGTNTIQNLAVGAGLAVAGANTGSLVIGVKGAATNTADTFGITFAGKAGSSATAASPDAVSATKIGLQGVEAVTVASGGTGFVANTLSLTQNTELKTVTITGDKALSLTLAGETGADVNFGGTTTGKGVSSFDGSAASGKLTLDLSNVVVTADAGGTVDDVILNIASGGLTIKGGSADDTIKVGAFSSTLTGNGGKDAFFVEKAVVLTGATAAATAVKTTITDFAAGDTIDLTGDTGVSTTLNKVTLTAGVQNLDDALDLVGATTKTVSWFNYGSDTYVVYNADASTGLDAGDVLVKLTGTIDLSNATVDGNGVLALA